MTLEIHEIKPDLFSTQIQVAGCYLEINDKILFLQNSLNKKESGCWGVPAGKLERDETPEQAACRELFEETNISIDPHSQIKWLGALYIRKLDVEFVFHILKIKLETMPIVQISEEHKAYAWADPALLKTIQLMAGAPEALDFYYRCSNQEALRE